MTSFEKREIQSAQTVQGMVRAKLCKSRARRSQARGLWRNRNLTQCSTLNTQKTHLGKHQGHAAVLGKPVSYPCPAYTVCHQNQAPDRCRPWGGPGELQGQLAQAAGHSCFPMHLRKAAAAWTDELQSCCCRQVCGQDNWQLCMSGAVAESSSPSLHGPTLLSYLPAWPRKSRG